MRMVSVLPDNLMASDDSMPSPGMIGKEERKHKTWIPAYAGMTKFKINGIRVLDLHTITTVV